MTHGCLRGFLYGLAPSILFWSLVCWLVWRFA
jgi:hypothetical protein